MFYMLRNKLPSSCWRSIYYAFVHPHIFYGIEIYANTCSTYLKPSGVARGGGAVRPGRHVPGDGILRG